MLECPQFLSARLASVIHTNYEPQKASSSKPVCLMYMFGMCCSVHTIPRHSKNTSHSANVLRQHLVYPLILLSIVADDGIHAPNCDSGCTSMIPLTCSYNSYSCRPPTSHSSSSICISLLFPSPISAFFPPSLPPSLPSLPSSLLSPLSFFLPYFTFLPPYICLLSFLLLLLLCFLCSFVLPLLIPHILFTNHSISTSSIRLPLISSTCTRRQAWSYSQRIELASRGTGHILDLYSPKLQDLRRKYVLHGNTCTYM